MASETEYDLNWITSVDDHIIEPPNVWQDRVPVQVQGHRSPRHRR